MKTFKIINELHTFGYSSYTGVIDSTVLEIKLNLKEGDNIRLAHTYLRNMSINLEDTVDYYYMDDFDVIVTGPNDFLSQTTCSLYNSEILEFVVPSNGVYTIQVKLRFKGDSPGTYTTYRTTKGVITLYSEDGYSIYVPSSC